jgi:hypothetical protein
LPRIRAFNGTIRLYRPGLKLDDPGYVHPRWFPQEIDAVRTPAAILRSVCAAQAPSSPSLDLYELARRAAPIELLKRTDELNELRAETARQKSNIDSLRADVALLNELLAEAERERGAGITSTTADPAPVRPTTLPPYDQPDRLATYLDSLYPERFLVLPRAIRSYADGALRDRALLADALDLLGVDLYCELHGVPGSRERFERRLRDLHLRIGGSISRGGRHNSQYEARYGDVTYSLDRHIRNETKTRSPERVLAVYFTYDPERDRIVLGSLPGHLDTRNS